MALTSSMLPRPSASADSDAAVRSSRYRLLTDQEQRQEVILTLCMRWMDIHGFLLMDLPLQAERVQRMIADLKAQQLNRSPPKRRPKSARQSRQGPLATSRAETATCQTTSVVEPSQFAAEINRAKAGIRESQERPRPTPDSGSDSFQNQVMLELQKLKKVRSRCLCAAFSVVEHVLMPMARLKPWIWRPSRTCVSRKSKRSTVRSSWKRNCGSRRDHLRNEEPWSSCLTKMRLMRMRWTILIKVETRLQTMRSTRIWMTT